MSHWIRAAAVVVALAVLVGGFSLVDRMEPKYTSSATLAVVPSFAEASERGIDLGRAASVGTYVTLLLDPATARQAGSPPVKVTAVVQEERPSVIQAAATGPAEAVRPGLRAIIDATRRRQPETGDAYRLDVFTAPGQADLASLPPGVARGVIVFLALLAGLTVLVLPGRIGFEGDRWALESEPSPLFFEATLIRVGPLTDSTSLLQVWGRWHNAAPLELGMPDLLVRDEARMVVVPAARHAGALAPVAGPGAPEWNGAYGIPAALFKRIGPPELALRAEGRTFPLELTPEIWAQASPEAQASDEPYAASTSS